MSVMLEDPFDLVGLIMLFVAAVVVLFLLIRDQKLRLWDLERRLRELEREKEGRQKADEPTPAAEPSPPDAAGGEPARSSALVRAKEQAREPKDAREPEESTPTRPPAPVPPPLPAAQSAPAAAPAWESTPPPAPSPYPVPATGGARAGLPVMAWLEAVGLKPPQEEDANLIAWWSTRAGLGLGVIAAVFFGIYVNQNTVPLVRLMELVFVAVALFAGGVWLERRQGGFGRALTAGGLGLFYVAAYASFGLPAMKVIESPVAGSVVQLVAVGLMAGWALWKRNEGVFSLSLVLGFVTAWFAQDQGIEPLPLVSLLVLAGAGSGLFVLRGWWSGFLVAVVGSSGGMVLLGFFHWRGGGGPPAEAGFGAAVLLSLLFVVALYLRRKQDQSLMPYVLPAVTGIGIAVGALVTWALGIDWEWFYATWAALLLATGWLWHGEAEGLWEVMWAKASVFVALYLVAVLEGPVRAYGLLAQAGSLAFLARRKDWLVFDMGALLAMLVGWWFAQGELASAHVALPGRAEWLVLGFLAGALGIVVWFGPGRRAEAARRVVVLAVLALLALGVLWSVVWRVEAAWAVLLALGGAVLFVGAGRWRGLWRSELIGAVFLVPAFFILADRGLSWSFRAVDVEGVLGPVLVWLAAAWIYAEWLVRCGSRSGRIVADGIMVLSVGSVVLAGTDLSGWEGVPACLLGLALLWALLHGRVALPDLRVLSVVPALCGGVWFVCLWSGEPPLGALLGALVAAVAYWSHDLVRRPSGADPGVDVACEVGRTVALGLVLFTTLHLLTGGSGEVMAFGAASSLLVALWWILKERGTAWLAISAAGLSLLTLLGLVSRDPWHLPAVLVLFVAFVANGLGLARSGRAEPLAFPKVASLLWGGAALVAVGGGLLLIGEVPGWATAGVALGAVLLLSAGFWGGLRGYRVLGLLGIGVAVLRLFMVDLDETFWRIVAFGVTGALLVGIGYVYNRFHRRLAGHDLDWRRGPAESNKH